ncbi:MAG: sigma-70 family RNA polymerase sigma factor [Deltaproteobacteria bacterium]|nr:sigma-70 family RNA polymerase sigma factor [Deltaproteobacteria bacterium]
MTDSDRIVVERFKNGDASAFDELLSRYEDRIYGFLYRMCRCPEGAADVTQETFLNAFRYLAEFRGDASFKNWLYKVAANSCYKYKRKGVNEPNFELSLEQFLPQEGGTALEIPDEALVPEGQALNAELAGQIEEAIGKLPKKYRLVIVLRDAEGLSGEETARVLDISTAAVKSRLHRARLFVRDELKDYFGSEKAKR